MEEKESVSMKVTPSEEELIKAIRNHKKSFPNGYPALLEYAERCFERLTDIYAE